MSSLYRGGADAYADVVNCIETWSLKMYKVPHQKFVKVYENANLIRIKKMPISLSAVYRGYHHSVNNDNLITLLNVSNVITS